MARPFKVGALMLLAGCFVTSALVRAVAVGPAAAQQLFPAEDAAEAGCGPGSEELLEAVRERSEQLDGRERDVTEREAALAIAEEELARQSEALATAQQQLESTMAVADSAAEQDLTQLTAIYENVKPKQAAVIFNNMEVNFAAGVLARMNAPAAAEILALMDTDRAYAVTVLMAARNLNAGGRAVPVRPPVSSNN